MIGEGPKAPPPLSDPPGSGRGGSFLPTRGRGVSGHGVRRPRSQAFFFRKLTADASDENRLFDQTRDVFVRETRIKHLFVVTGGPAEQGTKVDLGKVKPLSERMHGAGSIERAATYLVLALVSFGVQGQDRSIVHNLDLSARVRCVVFMDIEAHNLGPTQAARITDEQDCLVPQTA